MRFQSGVCHPAFPLSADIGVKTMARRRGFRTACVLLVVALTGLPWLGTKTATGAPARVPVIVQSADAAAAKRAVELVGGTVTREFPFIDAVAASIPRLRMAALRSTHGVTNVTLDAKVSFDGSAATRAQKSPPHIPRVINATQLWKKGVKGKGVTVALLDTGVYAAHRDLQGGNGSRVIHCEDFSHERGTEAECDDTFGHGTFMAGLIAGNGAASHGTYVGVAPMAKIVSVKVAGFDGSTDISHILAGIQWIVAHKDAYGIRALNLSLGSDSAQDYRISPLNLAVERAWQAGIVTLVSAGNSGPAGETIHKPADDPYVVTVGASNDEGTVGISDDRIPVFSSRGPTKANGFAKPDVVAPGVKTISLRSPGSAIDQNYGETAVVRNQYFRGTGTSMATAVTSGAVALMLQKHPNLDPDQVKFRLMDTARTIVDTDVNSAGQGVIDAEAATMSRTSQRANQDIDATSDGLGLLDSVPNEEGDRGSVRVEVVVQSPLGPVQVELVGEYVAQHDPDLLDLLNPDPLKAAGVVPWLGVTYAASAAECPLIPPPTQCGWNAASWDATTWANEQWLATTWAGTEFGFEATFWNGTQWRGTQWRNEDWDGTQWRGTQWRYAEWDGTQWRATTWQSKWYAAAWN